MLKKEVTLGVFAIIVVLATIFGVKYLAGENIFGSSKFYYTHVPNAKHLIRSSPVFIQGFQAGSVTDIIFKELDGNTGVMIEMRVDEPIGIPKNAVAEIIETGFVGGKAIRIVFDGTCENDCADGGSFLIGRPVPALETMIGSPEDLKPYTDKLKESLAEVFDTLGQQAKNPSGPGVGKMFHDIDIVLANLNKTTYNLNRLVAASSQNVETILKDLAEVTHTLKNSNVAIEKIINNTEGLTDKLNNSGIDKTIAGTNDAVGELKNTLQTTETAMKDLNTLLGNLNDGNGTMGKLLNDEGLYDNLAATTKHMELLLQDMRLNPKRYVNVSVFGKKQKEYQKSDNDPGLKQ